jgi:hypothetical protein
MKTKKSFLLGILFFCCMIQLHAQSELFNDFNFENKEIKAEDFTKVNTDFILEDFQSYMENKPEMSTKVNEKQSVEDILFAMQMVAIGAGLGLGEDETSWCLQAAYFYRLKQFQKSALYGVLGAAYSGFNFNDQTQNIIDIQLKLLMFTTLSKLNEIRLIYGLMAAYGFGKEKFNSFTTDITRFTLAAVVGFQLMLSTRWSLALETNLLSHNKWTYKPESGGEFKQDFTNFFINKNNLLTLTLLFNLGK